MINKERQEILDKIKECEKLGNFNTDVENDPPTKPLLPNEVDYLRKKLKNKIARHFVSHAAEKAINGLISSNQLIITNIVGEENLQGIQGSAFITSNHFHPFENIAIYKAFQKFAPKKHKFYRIIREGNYTAPPKGLDAFFKHCNTLPLSQNPRTMQKFLTAIETLSKKNSYFLIYPEQYMWWNYRKPRPFKDGAFKFACRLNKPIIPCFITMKDSPLYTDSDGLPVQEYTIHIEKPIYPDSNKTTLQNVEFMKNKNYEICKAIYENTYGIKLSFGEGKC